MQNFVINCVGSSFRELWDSFELNWITKSDSKWKSLKFKMCVEKLFIYSKIDIFGFCKS